MPVMRVPEVSATTFHIPSTGGVHLYSCTGTQIHLAARRPGSSSVEHT
nr:MAG TPA: hypothetical protein [Caudoviricetes sp.]